MDQGEPAKSESEAACAHGVVFFDGDCGLCHGWVRFVMRRDPAGRFRFSPLRGETITRRLDADTRASLPDAVVLLEPGGALRVRSDAVLSVLAGLGPGWRALAVVGRAVPRCLRDGVYRGVAKLRHRVPARPPRACPPMPAELRARWLA